MAEYVLFTDSCCDLPDALVKELDIRVLPLTVKIEEKEYVNHLDWHEIGVKEFYDLMRAGKMATTSAVNVWSFKEAMKLDLEAGRDVLCLAFSSGLSNTCQAAMMAAKELQEEYPQRKVLVVDTLAASMGQGMLVYYTALEMKKGKTIEEVYDWAMENRLHQCHWFTVNDLHHLKRGGRVSAATALVGSMLQIKPVLHVDDEGHLINVSKAKGRKASLRAMVDEMGKAVINPQEQTIFISHGDCLEDAQYVGDLARERFGVKDVIINPVGPVIGAHTGAGVVALFYFGTNR